jgi:HJR/Mrr/RecB family endonuclease
MDYLKFSGVLQEIIENYPDIDITEFLQQKLHIPQYKAVVLANRVEKEYFQKAKDIPTQHFFKTIYKIIDEAELSKTTSIFSVDSLSHTEFEHFIKWLFEELGYEMHLKKPVNETDSGIDFVAIKEGCKIAVHARKCPKAHQVSQSIVFLSLEAKGIYQCKKSIIVSTYFTCQAKKEAEKTGVELWDKDILEAKIKEIQEKINLEARSYFPEYQGSLLKSILHLEKTKDFIIESRAGGKHDLFLPGVKFPLLSFWVQSDTIVQCIFRIKNNEPVGENDGIALISRGSNISLNPDDINAYEIIIKYLEEFFD